MKIMESSENYLETILILKNRKGVVRSIDIANELNFSKASVSVAMKNLRENEYIVMGEDNTIALTQKGMEIANKMYERHIVLKKMLVSFGVSEEIAAEDACKIEHIISAETFDGIKKFTERQ